MHKKFLCQPHFRWNPMKLSAFFYRNFVKLDVWAEHLEFTGCAKANLDTFNGWCVQDFDFLVMLITLV